MPLGILEELWVYVQHPASQAHVGQERGGATGRENKLDFLGAIWEASPQTTVPHRDVWAVCRALPSCPCFDALWGMKADFSF